jgi:hypothetical protein
MQSQARRHRLLSLLWENILSTFYLAATYVPAPPAPAHLWTAASGDASRDNVLVLALFADDDPCAPAKPDLQIQRIGAVYDLRVLTQLWCTRGTCGTLAGIHDKSVISRKSLLRSEQGDASPRVQDGPGLDHGS